MDIAITGLGAVSPIGLSAEELCDGLLAGARGIRPAPWADLAGGGLYAAVDDRFDPLEWMDERVMAGTDGNARFALAASSQALNDAGLDPTDLDNRRTGVVHGTSMGGHLALSRAQFDFDRGGAAAVDRKTQIKIWTNMAAAQICLAHELHGVSTTVSTACASSLDALGTAAMYLQAGRADVVLVGATEGGYVCDPGQEHFVPAVNAAEQSYGMRPAGEDPTRALLPFAADRAGIVSGEGSAFFVLESAEHAAARGAPVRAWLRGVGSLADAYHPSSPEPEGRWEQEVMEEAHSAAGVVPGDIDALYAHATGTPKGDEAEIRALNRVFAGTDVVVTGIKGHTGHTGAASGAMSLMSGIRAMETGQVPAIAGTSTPDPEIEFDVALGAIRRMEIDTFQVNSFGFGGQNASAVVSRHR
ncbi:MAG: beta-ketoacyl-[acyl-carrier-protein] synthase family protein [Acidimicrobiales bacterium]